MPTDGSPVVASHFGLAPVDRKSHWFDRDEVLHKVISLRKIQWEPFEPFHFKEW